MESSDSNNREKECCEVCRSTIFNANIFEKIVCKQCSRAVHRFCYVPDLRDRKNFKCDQCRKDIQARCSICKNGNGILKDVGEKHWVHVMCGLFSPKIKIISYRTLEMKYISQNDLRDNEVEKTCLLCNHKSAEVFHCWHKDCKLYAHVGCVLGSRFHSGQECFLTYNLLDKHSMMLPFHMQNYDEHFISFRYLKKRKLKPFVCYQHNDDPHFVFCTCGRSKIRKDEQQVKQINCDRCKRWFHLQCTAVKNLNLDYECNGCKQNDFFKKSLFLPQIIERLAEIQSSGRLDRKSLKVLDSTIFRFSTNVEDICLQRKNIDEVNRFFLQRTLERLWKEDKYDERSHKHFNYKDRDSIVLEILNYITRREDKASKYISLKSIKEILDYLREKGREIGLNSEAFYQCEEFIKARIKYLQRHERDRIVQKDRTVQRDRNSQKDKISQKQRNSSRDKQKLLSSSSTIQKAATAFVQKSQDACAKQMTSSVFHHLNQVISKFNYGLQNKGPFSTEVLAKQTKDFIKTIERSDLAREAFSTLISKNTPILLQVLFKSRLDEEQYNVIFSKFRFLCSLRPKKKITQFQICRLMDWYDSAGFQNLHPSKRQQLNTIYREIIKDFKVVPNYEENEKNLHKVIAKITAGLPSRQICLIRNSLVKKLMFLASGSQICISDYTDIYYSIKKQKTLKSVSAPLKEQLVTVVEDIKTQLQDPAFSSSLTVSEKKELQRFMNRSNFYMKLVIYHTKVKGLGNFAGSVKVDQEIPFEELCVLGGFKNLKEMTFQAMTNWDMSPQSANFAFKLLCEQPLAGVSLSGRQREIVINFIKNILAAICPSYLDYPGTIYPNLLKSLCCLITEAGQERLYPSFKILLQQYNEWKKGLEKFNNINQQLQNLGSVFDIIDLATKKKTAVQTIRLDLTSELRKLQIIRVWGEISRKLLTTLPQTKFTLISLQAMKSYIDKCQYPENKLRKVVDSLYEEAKEIGRKLRYFEKGKFKDDELWEQINRISRKPWRFEGEEFLIKLKKVDLDLFFEILDFQEMIEQHSKLPEDLKQWSEQQSTVIALQKMRKTIIENPFRIQNLADFDHLYRKIYHLKCLEPIQNINQRQYNRMLSFGGTAIPALLEKTINLSMAYNKLELARKEVMQSRPREQILIPYDNKELQKDLIIDEAELYNLGTMNLNARRLKEKLRMLREQRADWQRYVQLIAQVTRQPISMPDIALEIVGMKRVVDQCIDDAKLILMGQSNQLYCQQSLELLQKYKSSGIKHHEMEHFETLCKHYRKIFDLQTRVLVDIKVYVEFNRLCEEYLEISKNLNIRKLRQDIFQQISSAYIARSGYPPEIGEVLLREGGYIIQKPLLSTDVVPKLMKITKRLFNIPLKGDIQNPSISSLQDSEAALKSASQASQGSRQMAAEQYVNPMKMQAEECRDRLILAMEPE